MGTVLEKIKDESNSKFQEMKSKIEAERRELQAIRSEYQQGMSEVLRLREEFENSQEQRAREWGELSSKLSGSSTMRTNPGVPPVAKSGSRTCERSCCWCPADCIKADVVCSLRSFSMEWNERVGCCSGTSVADTCRPNISVNDERTNC
jgi:hypothetical protein